MVKGKVVEFAEADERYPVVTHAPYRSVANEVPVPVPWKLTGFREARIKPNFVQQQPRPGSASGRPMPVSVAHFYEDKRPGSARSRKRQRSGTGPSRIGPSPMRTSKGLWSTESSFSDVSAGSVFDYADDGS